MKPLIFSSRIIVGLLFIFSGLVKANDPLGLTYKMQEFFEIWNSGLAGGSFFLKNILINFFEYLHTHALFLSVLIIGFEIIAGAALLTGWKVPFFSWLLLLMIIFFTFLTGYAYLSKNPDGSPKFTDCGCFGDCLKISPLASFLKDIGLTALIALLFFYRKKIQPVFSSAKTMGTMLIVTIFSFGLQWFALSYLPPVDCLPYKKGNNIAEKMKIPPGAVPDSFAIRFIYEKDGKQYEFSPTDLPEDFDTYTFKERIDKLVRKGNARPAITGFTLTGATKSDSAQIVLAQPYALILFYLDFSTPVKGWKKDFEEIYAIAMKKNLPVYLVATRIEETQNEINETSFKDIPVFQTDFTAIRTAARTNPCLYLLKEGTIVNKWSGKNIGNSEKELQQLEILPAATTEEN